MGKINYSVTSILKLRARIHDERFRPKVRRPRIFSQCVVRTLLDEDHRRCKEILLRSRDRRRRQRSKRTRTKATEFNETRRRAFTRENIIAVARLALWRRWRRSLLRPAMAPFAIANFCCYTPKGATLAMNPRFSEPANPLRALGNRFGYFAITNTRDIERLEEFQRICLAETLRAEKNFTSSTGGRACRSPQR